jgi:hypothetical protein
MAVEILSSQALLVLMPMLNVLKSLTDLKHSAIKLITAALIKVICASTHATQATSAPMQDLDAMYRFKLLNVLTFTVLAASVLDLLHHTTFNNSY